MAVERMKTMGIIGRISDMDKICRAVVLNGSVHLLNALSEINSNYFKITASEENIEAIEESAQLSPYSGSKSFDEDEEVIKSLYGIFDFKPVLYSGLLGIEHDYGHMMEEIKSHYHSIKDLWTKIEDKKRLVEEKKSYIKNLSYMRNIDMNVGDLLNLRYLRLRLFIVTRENYGRLKGNYENIPSLILRLATQEDSVTVLSVAPRSFDEEIERLFISLNYQELRLPEGYTGSAQEIIDKLNMEIKILAEIRQMKLNRSKSSEETLVAM